MICVMLVNDYPLISSLVTSSLENEKDVEIASSCTTQDDLAASIHSAAQQDKDTISPGIARELIDRVYKLAGQYTALNVEILDKVSLNEQEQVVLNLVGENRSNIEIAQHLQI